MAGSTLLRISVALALGALASALPACSLEKPSLVRATDPGHTGLERCAACHTGAYVDWRKSLHSKAMAVPADSTVVGDFSDVTYTYGGVTSRMFREGDDDFYMETLGPEGETEAYRVDYVVGVRQHQAYLTRFPDGRLQVLPLYHDGKLGRWVDAQEGSVVEGGDPLSPEDYYFWTNRGRAWNYHCYNCHASRVVKNYDPEQDRYDSTVGSLAIDCEACHGPGLKHDVTRGTPGIGLETPDLLALSRDTQIEVCGRCHAAKQILKDDYEPTGSFYDSYLLHLPDIEEFHPDGQPRVYLYPMALHMMSPCYDEGGLVCTDCHDAHGSNYPVDLVADKHTTALCADCHPVETEDPTGHSHHKAGSPGNTCISCHMPTHRVTGEDMTDHRIVSPVPEASIAYGVPNSCNAKGCHADKTTSWAADYARQWYGDYQEREVARLRPFVLGRARDPAAAADLSRVVADTSEMVVWRSVAASLLGPIRDSRSIPALVSGLSAAAPMVRVRSAVSLGQIGDPRAIPALMSALDDTIRPVRIYSAFALVDLGYWPDSGPVGDLFRSAMAEHRDVVSSDQSDDPGILASLGSMEERAGRYAAAAEVYERVGRLDPRHPKTGEDLGRIRREMAVRDQGLPALRAAVERAPESFWARAQLGAFYLVHGDPQNAGLQLRAAAGAVQSPEAYRLLGDALWAEGDGSGAAEAYGSALALRRLDRRSLEGLVRVSFARRETTQREETPATDVPASTRERAALGVELARSGDYAEAARVFAAAIEREADALRTSPVRVDDVAGLTRSGAAWLVSRADSVFEAGVASFGEGDAAGAQAAFLSALEWDSASARSRLMLALLHQAEGDVDAAIREAREGLLADPTFAEGYSTLGAIHAGRGDLVGARTNMEIGAAIDPQAPLVAMTLAELYLNIGEYDLAAAIADGLLERNTRDEGALMLRQEIERRRSGS